MKLIKTTNNGLMKFSTLDAVAGNTLADMLEVRHVDLMRVIKKVLKYEEKRKSHCVSLRSEIVHIVEEKELKFNAIFKEHTYVNKRGRTYQTYIMNEDALYLIVANTQSTKAHELKVMFKSEFNKMRDERSTREQLKQHHVIFTDGVKHLSKCLKIDGSKHYARIYSTIQLQINKAIIGKSTPRGIKIPEYRDTLSKCNLTNIKSLEQAVVLVINKCFRVGITARAIRAEVRRFINSDSVAIMYR